MNNSQKAARRRWRGNLNHIPVSIAYDFELQYIIDNKRSDGFHSSPSRIEAAKAELAARRSQASD